jgi:hypothetical protein
VLCRTSGPIPVEREAFLFTNAVCHLAGRRGAPEVAISTWHALPGREAIERDTALRDSRRQLERALGRYFWLQIRVWEKPVAHHEVR